MRQLFSFLAVCFCALTIAFPASAHKSNPTNYLEGPHDGIYLLAQPAENGEIKAGIYLELQRGWHTYWRNPGDAGEAPTIKAQLINKDGTRLDSTNQVTDWEAPRKFSEAGLTTYGFEKHTFLPFILHADEQNLADTAIIADVHWLVCEKVCIPRHAVLSLKLADVNAAPYMPSYRQTAREHDAATPVALSSVIPAHFSQSADKKLSLLVPNVNSKNLKSAYFYPNKAGLIDANAPQSLTTSGRDISLSLTPDQNSHDAIENLPGTLVLTYKSGPSQSIRLDQVNPDGTVASASGSSLGVLSFFRLLALAFLGGLVLNLMPCVFPVLALKAFSVAKAGSTEGKKERIGSAIAYTVGVVGSFVLLGGLVIALRAGGQEVGWGFQFQSPLFILFLSWFLLALGLNLLSVFEIQVAVPGQSAAAQGGLKGDFLTGLLAVIVASPCTAPFMGTALAAALNASPVVGLLLFAGLGLGLAAPYPALALSPKLAHFIPKPGAWMEVFKHCLAFPLLATCIWLVWVGTQQTGSSFVLWCLGGALLIAICLWAFGQFQAKAMSASSVKFKVFAWVALIVALVPVAATVYYNPLSIREASEPIIADDQSSVTYSEDKLAEMRKEGKPVLIDMSADWCITCLVNERTAFSSSRVKAYFKEHNITIMRGDWTNKDPKISAFLKSYKRDGVPLYVWFAAGLPEDRPGKVLPQILTPGVLLDEIQDDQLVAPEPIKN